MQAEDDNAGSAATGGSAGPTDMDSLIAARRFQLRDDNWDLYPYSRLDTGLTDSRSAGPSDLAADGLMA